MHFPLSHALPYRVELEGVWRWLIRQDEVSGVGVTGEESTSAAAACKASLAATASPIGLFRIFSSVNRFRAEIGFV